MVDKAVEKRTVCGGSNSSSSSSNKGFHCCCWSSSLRAAFFLLLVPRCCGCHGRGHSSRSSSRVVKLTSFSTTFTTVTGTIFGPRKGRVCFCVQEDPASHPFLLLEFAMPTYLLVKEMESGLLRITLECAKSRASCEQEVEVLPLFEEPVWGMYCNGRKVGFATKKPVKTEADSAMFSTLMTLTQSVSNGAGVIPSRLNRIMSASAAGDCAEFEKEGGRYEEDEEILYMRATYQRVMGSSDSEAFHMIGPDGSQSQEISIFLTRS